MVRPNFRRRLAYTNFAIFGFLTTVSFAQQSERSTIGLAAPELSIAHWISDSAQDTASEVGFRNGNVYVIDFWTTWSEPSIASLTQLAELQKENLTANVDVICVTDEDLETVTEFLKRKSPLGVTYKQVTSTLQLVSDPDGSVHSRYMDAAGVSSIPVAFVVGKSGLIEWYGHPEELAQVLVAIVSDSWDRQKFQEQLASQRNLEDAIAQAKQLAMNGKVKVAEKIIADLIVKTRDPDQRASLERIQQSLSLSAQKTSGVSQYYREQLLNLGDDPLALGEFARWLSKELREDGELISLYSPTVDLIVSVAEKDESNAAYLWNSVAKLQQANGDLTDAIKSQTICVQTSNVTSQPRQQLFLKELEAQKVEASKITPAVKDLDSFKI